MSSELLSLPIQFGDELSYMKHASRFIYECQRNWRSKEAIDNGRSVMEVCMKMEEWIFNKVVSDCSPMEGNVIWNSKDAIQQYCDMTYRVSVHLDEWNCDWKKTFEELPRIIVHRLNQTHNTQEFRGGVQKLRMTENEDIAGMFKPMLSAPTNPGSDLPPMGGRRGSKKHLQQVSLQQSNTIDAFRGIVKNKQQGVGLRMANSVMNLSGTASDADVDADADVDVDVDADGTEGGEFMDGMRQSSQHAQQPYNFDDEEEEDDFGYSDAYGGGGSVGAMGLRHSGPSIGDFLHQAGGSSSTDLYGADGGNFDFDDDEFGFDMTEGMPSVGSGGGTNSQLSPDRLGGGGADYIPGAGWDDSNSPMAMPAYARQQQEKLQEQQRQLQAERETERRKREEQQQQISLNEDRHALNDMEF